MKALVLTWGVVVVEIEAGLSQPYDSRFPCQLTQARVGVRGDRLSVMRMDTKHGKDIPLLLG